jgi:hypothetical protein
MAAPIKEPEQLPGKSIHDQLGQKVGEVKELYRQSDQAAWVTVEVSTGLTGSRIAFVPLARLKEEDDQVRVPYRKQHIAGAPEVEPSDELSPEDDRRLRDHYGIDRADQEVRDNGDSYAARVPDGDGPPKKLEQSS